MVGKIIREARMELGISQKQLAGYEMTRAYVSLIEQGHAKPAEKTLKIIARRLGKPLEYFLGDELGEKTEFCDAILERVRSRMKQREYGSALNLLQNIFPLSYDPKIVAEAYYLTLSIKDELEAYDEIVAISEEALASLLKLKDRDLLVSSYLIAARAVFQLEDFALTQKYADQTIKYSTQLKKLQPERIKGLIYLGATYLRVGDVAEALQCYREAEAEAAMSGEYKLYGEICLGLARACFLLAQVDEALKWNAKALELFEKHGLVESVLAVHNKAIFDAASGDKRKMAETLQQCLHVYEKQGLTVQQAQVHSELARYYMEIGDRASARECCSKGVKCLELKDDAVLRARLYRLMGVLHKADGVSDLAYYFIRMSYDLFTRLHAKKEALLSRELIHSESDGVQTVLNHEFGR